jgi:membrane protein DedA with SNARE-associated domain
LGLTERHSSPKHGGRTGRVEAYITAVLGGFLWESVPARTFTIWQALGLLWSVGVTIAGYVLGSSIPGIDQYLLPIVALVVIVSLIPLGLELLRNRKQRTETDGRS